MSQGPKRRPRPKRGRKRKKALDLSALHLPNSRSSAETQGPLSAGFDPTGAKGHQQYYSQSSDPRDLGSLLSYGSTKLPFTYAWTDNRVEQVRSFKHWLFVGIDKTATKVASAMPNVTLVKSGSDAKDTSKFLSPYERRRALTPLLTHQQLEPVNDDHPLSRLLSDPNDPDTSYDLWYETVMYRRLTGVAYWWVPKNSLGLPAAIWVVPSHWMWPVTGTDKQIAAWEIRPVEGNYLRKMVPADEIIEFKGKNPVSKIDGYSPLTAVSQWADVQHSTDRGKWHAYRNGTFPTVAIQFDGSLNDPSEPDLRRIEAKFISRMVGESRSNLPLFLPPGVTVRPLVIKPNEMMFGDTAREMRDNILAALGVPVELVDVRGDTLKAEGAFYNQTVNPLCHHLGLVLSEKLASQYPQEDGRLRVWWEKFTPDDPRLENENVKVDLLCAATTPNERRISRGKRPYDGEWETFGNTPIVPVNMAPGALPGGGDHLAGDENNPPSNEQPALNDDDYKHLLNGRFTGH